MRSPFSKKIAPEGASCPKCGAAADAGPFCPSCGANLARTERKGGRARGARRRRAAREVERIAGSGAVAVANDLAGFDLLFSDGIADLGDGVFSKTVEFGDISYEHERRETKDDIFDKFSQLHASFPPESCYQINLVNLPVSQTRVERYLEEAGPAADLARSYNEIIEERQRRGRMEFDRRNFISFAVAAPSAADASSALQTATESVATHLSRLQVRSESLDGLARAKLVHDLLAGPSEPFMFDYSRLAQTRKEHVRDFVVPAWCAYSPAERILRRELEMPGRVVKTYRIRDFGSDLSDRALRSIRALPIPMNISLLFRPQPKGKTVQRIRQNIDVVQAEMYDYSAAVGKAGGDPTLLPPALEDKEAEGRELLDFVREQDQQVSWFQGLITVYAEDSDEMSRYHRLLMDERGAWSVDIVEMPLKQEPALTSALPLAKSVLDRDYRSLTTAEGAALIPFSSQNIHDDPKRSYLLGVDRVSGAEILVDPDRLKSPHMWIFGMTGSGKGMQVNSFLTYSLCQHPRTVLDEETGAWSPADPTCPQWHVFDFHEEYVAVAERFGASVNRFGPGHNSCLNPMDMSDAAGELTIKDMRANTDFFLALLESMMDRALSQREKSLLDRCLIATYEPHLGKETRPDLSDLYGALRSEQGEVAAGLADSLEMYVTGSMSSFAAQTNVETDELLNVYVMSELGDTMQTLGMMSALQHVRQCTFGNYALGKPTYLLIEECQILFDNDAAVRVLDSYFGELRKYGLHIVCVTQLPNRVLEHKRAVNLFENSGLFVFLPQQQRNAQTITEMFRLSKSQAEYISQSAEAGTGLVVADGVKIAMRNTIPRETALYELWNTDPYKLAKLGKDRG